MSITPINHYAITTGQPGVINEEAYTVLELVGKCGSKVNECIETVNDVDDRMSTAELQYGVVRQLAQQGIRDSAAAQAAADAAQADVDALEQTVSDLSAATGSPCEAAFIPFYEFMPEHAGTNGEWSQIAYNFFNTYIAPEFAKIKINFVPFPHVSISKEYRFTIKHSNPTYSNSQNVQTTGYMNIYLHYYPSDGGVANATVDLYIAPEFTPPNAYADYLCYGRTIFTAKINPGNYSNDGIPLSAVHLQPFGVWSLNVANYQE